MIRNLGLDVSLVGRVALGTLLGFLVGWEREFRGSSAGDRTFSLIALGATALAVLGVENFPAAAEKVIAGIVTGIGFLGAGLIMRGDAGGVRGLTTAASLWATAAVGTLAGAGEPAIAVLLAALIVLVLESSHIPVLRRIAGQHEGTATAREPDLGEDE